MNIAVNQKQIKKGYKVVRIRNDKRFSSNVYGYAEIEYKKGQWVKGKYFKHYETGKKIFLPLFLFEHLEDAMDYVEDAIGYAYGSLGIKPSAAEIWEVKYLSAKVIKKLGEFGYLARGIYYPQTSEGRVPSGTVFAEKIKLVKRCGGKK